MFLIRYAIPFNDTIKCNLIKVNENKIYVRFDKNAFKLQNKQMETKSINKVNLMYIAYHNHFAQVDFVANG